MSADLVARLPRYLGAAFVFQFLTSLAAGLLSVSILAGGISEVLANVSDSLVTMRTTILLELLTSVGIIVLASLLYVVLRQQNPAIALVALGLWIAEAVMLAVKSLGLYSLLDVSEAFVDAGTTGESFHENSGTLSLGFSQHAGDVAMLLFCLGGLLWYSLLLKSRIVPQILALWGLIAVPLVLVATLLLIWDRGIDPSKALYALYVPFELVVGLWLMVKGASVLPPNGENQHQPMSAMTVVVGEGPEQPSAAP